MMTECAELDRSLNPASAAAGDRPGVLIACHAHAAEQIGGAFKLATEFAEHLARHGEKVYFVCGTKERAPANPTTIQGVEVWRYADVQPSSSQLKSLWRHVRGACRVTREICRRGHIACVNGHSPLQFLGASLAVGKRVQQVYSVHSPFVDEVESNWGDGPVNFAKRLKARSASAIEGINCRRSDVVQGDSQFTIGTLARRYGPRVGKKCVVAPGWVDTTRFQPARDLPAVRAALAGPWLTSLPIFFTVRRLESRMGLEALVEAAALLRDAGQEFRVILGGGGSLEAKLRQLVVERGLSEIAHLTGRIPADDLPQCFAAADCFVLPTRALECFGLIVLEAYACGTPVIGTPVGAIPELVAEHGREWLTTGTSAAEIAERMNAFLHGRLTADRTQLRTLSDRWSAERGLHTLSRLVLEGALTR